MNRIIYISAGISASVNAINAGCCCKNNNGDKSHKSNSKPLVDVEFIYRGSSLDSVDDGAKKDFEGVCGSIKGLFKFSVNDVLTNVHVYSRKMDPCVIVGTQAIVDKQNPKVKSDGVQKLGKTGLYVCCIGQGSAGSIHIIPKNAVNITAADDKGMKFNIEVNVHQVLSLVD